MGTCPIAWQSPMFALITSLKGFFTPCNTKHTTISQQYEYIRDRLNIQSNILKC